MPLSTDLYDVVLAHACPHCGHVTEKPGRYFWRMRHYHCPRCERPVHLSYEEKLKLFDDHVTGRRSKGNSP
jgi:DNA-directed RNA polymerase subunit RPC12/RpoP